MKILKKKIKDCEFTNGTPTKVLDIEYSHRWESGRILVKDFIESDYNNVLKQLRVKVREHYNNQKVLKAHNKERVIA